MRVKIARVDPSNRKAPRTLQGHRVLLFSQSRQMLNIIERFVNDVGWSHARLDGSTPVGTRQVSKRIHIWC